MKEVGFAGVGSANYRHVVDFGAPEESVFIMDAGVNESRFSKHFFDLAPKNTGAEPWLPMQLNSEEEAAKQAATTTIFAKGERSDL